MSNGVFGFDDFRNVAVGEVPIKTADGAFVGADPTEGTGDMLKSVYDIDGNGIVDNAEKLGGELPNHYAVDSKVVHNTGIENVAGVKKFTDGIETSNIKFDVSLSETCAQGEMSWDTESGTLKVGMIGDDVCLNLGQEMFIYVKNISGVDIANGVPVYVSNDGNSVNANIEIDFADANIQDTCRKTLAMTTEDIANNQFGYVTTFGLVRNINTQGYAEGAEIFVKQGGGYTNVKPDLPASITRLGFCVRGHQTEGIIFINIDQKSVKDILTDSGDLTIKTDVEKTMFLEQPCYRDEFPTQLVPAGGAAAPDQENYTIAGVSTRRYSFAGVNTEERISGSFEIPHDYKTDAPIEVHVHWLPATTGAGNVQWHFDWAFLKVDTAPQSETTLSIVDSTNNQQFYHKIKAFGNLPTNGYALGDKILFTLRRTPNGALDTYTGDAILEQIALHIPVDTLGSRKIYVK